MAGLLSIMSSLDEALDLYRMTPVLYKAVTMLSYVDLPASEADIRAAWPDGALPDDIRELWLRSRSARLLVEETYGASGLELLSPAKSATFTSEWFSEREDMREGDVLVGDFLGDADRLVYAPSESGLRRLLVADPIDDRNDWYGAARTIAGFLIRYHESRGDYFWSRHSIFFDPGRRE